MDEIQITDLSSRVLNAMRARNLKAKPITEFERYGLRRILLHFSEHEWIAYGGPQKRMSEDTVAAFVKKYGISAKRICPSILDRVHPHMLRHTRAMHLYQDGVPLTLISEFLGHAQIETTRVYAYADTEMKRKAIQKANSTTPHTIPDAIWDTDDKEMMRKLAGLK